MRSQESGGSQSHKCSKWLCNHQRMHHGHAFLQVMPWNIHWYPRLHLKPAARVVGFSFPLTSFPSRAMCRVSSALRLPSKRPMAAFRIAPTEKWLEHVKQAGPLANPASEVRMV